MVAGRDLGDRRSRFLDHAGPLMPEHHRPRHEREYGSGLEIGVANAGRHHAHEHFVRARPVELDVLELGMRISLPRHRRPDLHRSSPCSGASLAGSPATADDSVAGPMGKRGSVSRETSDRPQPRPPLCRPAAAPLRGLAPRARPRALHRRFRAARSGPRRLRALAARPRAHPRNRHRRGKTRGRRAGRSHRRRLRGGRLQGHPRMCRFRATRCATTCPPSSARPRRPILDEPHFPLAIERVRHVGEAVAVVIAETIFAARDAAEKIEVDYEPLPAVTDVREAIAPGAPLLWDAARNNIARRRRVRRPRRDRSAPSLPPRS